MILVTALNGKDFYLNPDLIYRLEENSDTYITLVDGKTVIVQESVESVVQRIVEYRRQITQPIVGKNEEI
ncbi:flagellar FlbD family protein [Enterococcus olivae]